MNDARLGTTIRQTLAAYRRHNASRFGAALAFYIVFTLTPTLLIAIGVAGAVFGKARAERAILEWIAVSFGAAAGAAIATLIKAAVLWQAGWLATIFGISSLYFGVSGVYRQIDDALRTIWSDAPDGGDVEPGGIRSRLASMVLVGVAAVVVLIAVIADGAISVTATYLASRAAAGIWLLRPAQLIASAVILTVLFATVFRYLAQRVVWRDVGPGAAMTAVLFVIGKYALGVYLAKAAVGSPFGAAGSIVVVLLWSYWSAQIFFFGLEFTHTYARQRR